MSAKRAIRGLRTEIYIDYQIQESRGANESSSNWFGAQPEDKPDQPEQPEQPAQPPAQQEQEEQAGAGDQPPQQRQIPRE